MRQLLSSFAFCCLLALPLAAQEEALHGTWEATFGETTLRLTFQADGAFEINQVFRGFGEAILADAEAAGAEVPAIETLSVHGTGTYGVVGDSLWADIAELEVLVDGEDFVEILTQIARDLARFAADLGEISEEDYPEFEQAAIDEYVAGFEDEFFAEFRAGRNGTYVVEGDILFITNTAEEDGVLELHRIDDATAVTPTAWGAVKAAWRPAR